MKIVLVLALLTVVIVPAPVAAAPEPVGDNPPCVVTASTCVPATNYLRFTGRLTPSPGGGQDVFGLSTALAGNMAIVGAPWDSTKGYRSGAVYIFQNDNGTWKQVARIAPKQPMAKALFGSSVEMQGNTLVIGAPGERQDKLISAGAVYVFQRNDKGDWIEQARLTSNDTLAGDFFGTAVALAGDELIVGAHLEDGRGVDSGAVYILRRTDGKWVQVAKLQPTEIKGGTLFGNAIAAEGNRLAIGAYGYDGTSPGGGAVFVYQRDTSGNWQQVQMIQTEKRKAFAEFGWSVALRGNRLLVGAPYEDESDRKMGAAYLFTLDGNQKWQETARLGYSDPRWHERFGASVALADNFAIVGAPYGVAYLYEPDETGKKWQQGAKLVGDFPFTDNLFSRTLATDGQTILVGVPATQKQPDNAGTAYLFQLTGMAQP